MLLILKHSTHTHIYKYAHNKSPNHGAFIGLFIVSLLFLSINSLVAHDFTNGF